MSEFTTSTVMEGYLKDIYSKIVDPIPREAQIVGDVKFKGGAEELGNQLVMDVQISDEGGFTHSGSEDAFTLNDAISMETKKALVDGYSIALKGSIAYVMAARASKTRKAFMTICGHKMKNLVSSAKKRLACEMLHGQRGIGIAASAVDPSGAATIAVTFTAASWAPFIWQGKKGHLVVFVLADLSAYVTGTLNFTVTSCNVGTRTVTFTEVTSGDADELYTGIADATAFWAGTITPGGTPAYSTMAGMIKIATNVSSTLFNIDASTVDVWQGNEYACASASLSLSKILKGAGQLADRGATGKLKMYVSNPTWENIFTDQAALRRYNAEMKALKLGGRAISVAYQGTTIDIVGDGFMKGSEALLIEPNKWKRIGAMDLGFKIPGLPKGGDTFMHDATKAGFSYRYFGHQAVFCEMPSHQMVFTGIVNS